MIHRIVKLTFHPENTEQFLSLFLSVKKKIEAFPGCMGVRLLRDTHQANIFFTYSDWQSDDDLQAYRQSALFDDTWRKTKALFSGKPEAWSVEEQIFSSVPDSV